MHGQTSKGFSLIELMVVLAIVVILSLIAPPSYQRQLDNYKVRKAGEDLVSLISNARSSAVKLHRQVNVSFTNGASWCAGAKSAVAPTAGAIAASAIACNCATTNASACLVDTEQLAIPIAKHPGVSMGTGATALVFDGVTGATVGLAGSTISLTSPRNYFTATVTVTPLGQSTLAIN